MVAATSRPSAASPLRRYLTINGETPALQIVTVVVLYAVTMVVVPGYGTWRSIVSILTLGAFVGLASVGQTIAALLRGMDLSIPQVIGMANVFISEMVGAQQWPFPVAAGFILIAATFIGAFNGFVSKRFGIHPLLVTIGMGAVITGVVRAVGPNGGKATAPPPQWLTDFASPDRTTVFIPVPPVVVIWAIAAIFMAILLTRTTFGKWLYATGSNPRAADLARVPTTLVWTVGFAISALFAAITGILLAGFAQQGALSIGDPFLFQTIVTVVLGGTTLAGGRGDYWRTVLGAIILMEITTLFGALGFDTTTLQMLLGAVMIIAVTAYGRQEHVRNRV